MGLLEVKRKISRNYLGKEGIHGVGMDTDKNAIYVYTSHENLTCSDQIKQEASPFEVIIISSDEQASIHDVKGD